MRCALALLFARYFSHRELDRLELPVAHAFYSGNKATWLWVAVDHLLRKVVALVFKGSFCRAYAGDDERSLTLPRRQCNKDKLSLRVRSDLHELEI